MTILASIWAQDVKGVLGSGTDMLWRVPADFAHFKKSTLGCPIIMGRRSWMALGGALPGRTNIVITRSPDFEAPKALVVHSLEEALELAKGIAEAEGAHHVWITGGGAVYEQTMDLVDELVVTELDFDAAAVHPGTPIVKAPLIDEEVWGVDPKRSDEDWQVKSGDARWRVRTYVRR